MPGVIGFVICMANAICQAAVYDDSHQTISAVASVFCFVCGIVCVRIWFKAAR